ncbi:thiamine biosynthesis protein ThiI [Haladaptatus paucihalophilus DX253]|uniref:Probable tRNA sulfurtransferase n=1 Tax=Haladaptatus paucihalophilus DX253 TaxID=797209 RepID=E7QUW3_HALPU|nr:tRNA uracil 4-sulfurtransferase ThiI [Haladaptatus paucihalophilus]EFW91770.1 thiamine biosynthesis protein ThiI [Haladaptatus paucihalophilus DX253]SHJ94517.1 thiamine biosynthesis protein ThiI [Haladaptatus paucihalophilus DX253]
MHPSGADTVLVRHGDVGVKSGKVQTEMERRLRDNIAAILADRGIDAEVERRWSRLLVHATEENVEEATTAAADTFGVQSASAAAVVSPEQAVIEETLADAAREHYHEGTFAVRARRSSKDHPFTSAELEREGGTAVWNAVENPEVDLDDPDITFSVEVRDDEAFVFLEKRDGPGGLPLGTQTKLVSLVSGGIDSPVATWEVMKRGSPVIPVYLDLGDYGGIDHRARAVETVRKLAKYAPEQDMRVRKVPAGEAMTLLGEEVGPARMLVFRRFMYRVAEHIAREESAHGIVTGEAIGQKSSQTARNLGVVGTATTMPIHRPLLTMDKSDIVARARRIDTYTDSTIPAGCNRLAPDYPETNATHEIAQNAEPDDLFELAKAAAENVELIDL